MTTMSLQAKTAAKTSRLNIFHTTKRQVCACQVPRAKGLRQMEVDGRITTRPSLRNGKKLSVDMRGMRCLPSRERSDEGS